MNSTENPAEHNGKPPRDPRAAAGYYLERGLLPIPVPTRSKAPTIDDWPNLRPSATDLDGLFPAGPPTNIGLLLGAPSNNIVDADLDIGEAIAAAKILMPPTPMVSGRKSKPRSHLWYRVDQAPDKTEQFRDPINQAMLLELRSTGGQTVVPWSTHEGGEIVGWHDFGEPAEEKIEELRTAVQQTAAAALLARYWPDKGGRHGAALALAGGLLSAEWAADATKQFISAVCAAAQDSEEQDRLAAVDSTAERIADGEDATGWPTLEKSLKGDGKAIVRQVKKWLGIAAKKKGDGKKEVESAGTKLVKLVKAAGVNLFRSPEQTAYAIVPCGGHKEAWPLKSTGFRRWLSRLFYDADGKAAPAEAIAAALNTLEGFALFDGEEEPVYVRLAGDLEKIYLDLADETWRVVEIDAHGWRIVEESPVRFIRPRGLLALPEPQRAGSLIELRPFVNVKSEDGWRLLLGFLFGAFHPFGPYPVLAEVGEQGSAKTTLGRLLRSVIDPNKAPLRRKPRDERDLAIAASNGWLVAFDNLSDLPDWLSDALCCISTGGGFGTRELYTDDEEKLFAYKRPQLLTSIEDVVTRGDLLDRSLFLELEAIPKKQRKAEAAIDRNFDKARPRILGALLTAVSAGLRNLPSTSLEELPRMADFALWAEACGRSIGWQPGAFVAAYERNRAEANDQALDISPITPILRAALDGQQDGTWQGTASELLEWLNGHAEEKIRKAKNWPASPKAMGNLIRRMAPNLRLSGISVQIERVGKARTRTITLTLQAPPENDCKDSSAPSAGPSGMGFDDVNTNRDDSCGASAGGQMPEDDSSAIRPHAPDSSACSTEADESEPRRTVGGQILGENASALNVNEIKDLSQEIGEADKADAFLQPLSGLLPDGTAYRIVRDAAELSMVAQAIDDSTRIGLDCETTGLDPRKDRIRLLQLATEHGLYIVDCFAVDARPLFEVLCEKPLIGHNLSFDLGFLAALGFEPKDVRCTMLLSQLLYGTRRPKGFHTLQSAVSRETQCTLNKELQGSDWTGALSGEQIAYAAFDAFVLLPLYDALAAKIEAAGMARVAEIEQRCLPAMVWLEQAGVPFDRDAWKALAEHAAEEVEELSQRLDELAPPREGYLSKSGAWTWTSDKHVKQVFADLGTPIEKTDDDTLAALSHPLADLLRQYRSAQKRKGTYGLKWLKQHAAEDGRVYASFHQIGTDTGRMSCSDPNLQQIPKDGAYRRCFRAAPGHVLLKADFSQIQLRIACFTAKEKQMLEAYKTGADLHTLTAQKMCGREEVTKAERSMAKPVNFGMIFGLSAESLRVKAKSEYNIDLSPQDAIGFRNAFFSAWPNIKRWHNHLAATNPSEVFTIAGRRITLPEQKRYPGAAANYIVQGSEGDGMKAGFALLWERRSECPEARPVIAAHDELVIECPQEHAEKAAEWIKRAMIDGMAPLIKPVPVEVEVKSAQTWGGA